MLFVIFFSAGLARYALGCECVKDFTYFPELQLASPPQVGSCRSRPGSKCFYLWEELVRADLPLDEHECYAPDETQCSFSFATAYRAMFVTNSSTSESCSEMLQASINALYYYCGGHSVCFSPDGTTRKFNEINSEWKIWLNETYRCSTASGSRCSVTVMLTIIGMVAYGFF